MTSTLHLDPIIITRDRSAVSTTGLPAAQLPAAPKPRQGHGALDRELPEGRWLLLAGISALLATLAAGAWEWTVRSWGYPASVDDSPLLWSEVRDEVARDPTGTAIVGASRIRFAIDHDSWEAVTGQRPHQLAIDGTCALSLLHDLATDESFRGTLVVGVTPAIFFSPQVPLLNRRSQAAFAARADRTPADRVEHALAMQLEQRLAFLQQDDLALSAVLKRLPIADRAGSVLPPRMPEMLSDATRERQARMLPRLEHDPAHQAAVEQVWLGILPPADAPIPAEIPPELLQAIVDDVRAIEDRGGRVAFVHCPHTETFKEREDTLFPRSGWWDRLIAATGAPGIHYADHPEVAALPCPEWSHITYADSKRFTTVVARLVLAAFSERERRSGGP